VTDETRENLNNRINDRFYASIDAVRAPDGRVVCRSELNPVGINPNAQGVLDPIALGSGCIPTSIFGAGAVSPAAARWFNTTTRTTSRLTQFVGSAIATNNSLFAMPLGAGDASLVAGAEFRRETSRQRTDPLDVAGLTFLNAIPSSSGAYEVKEGYAEVALPVLSDRLFVQNLTLDGAARFSDYSTVGHTKAWRWGVDWAIDDNVRLRGTMSSAVRAPNIGELYSGESENFFSVGDPCSAREIPNARDRTVRAANCQALGIPVGWQSTNSASIRGVSGSNTALKPERGRTWTAGVVLTPTVLPGFGITADYWNILLSNAIDAPGGGIASHCVDSAAGIGNIYCSNVQRDPVTHELIFIRSVDMNIASSGTSGVDLGAYYARAVGHGHLRLDINATRVIGYTERPYQDDLTNTVNENGTLGFPEWKGTLRSSYGTGGWLFSWTTRYFSSMLRVSNESYRANPTQTTPIRAGAGFFNDLRANYTFGPSGWQAYAGITNVFDRNPPVNLFGTGGGSALYDALGRAYFAGFNYAF
jgi:outer membrane receptor protein involved in Fe transport